VAEATLLVNKKERRRKRERQTDRKIDQGPDIPNDLPPVTYFLQLGPTSSVSNMFQNSVTS
jgi:hypothetical protein